MANQVNGEVPQPAPTKKRLRDFGEETLGGFAPYQINENQTEYSLYNLPYLPTQNNLDENTISLNATHGALLKPNLYLHNINAHRHLQLLNKTFIELKKTNGQKPFITTDATFPGSGAYGAGLITDMSRSWANLRGVISQAMSLSLFGIGNTVVDSCGSLGKIDLELCARWNQLAAFMPMVRGYFNETY